MERGKLSPRSPILRSFGTLPPWGWVLVVGFLLHGFFLAKGVPLVHRWGLWFWQPTDKVPGSVWGVLVLGLVPAAGVYGVLTLRTTTGIRLLAIYGLGVGIQFGTGLLEGRGIDGIRDRIVHSGHAEFARVSVEGPPLCRVLLEYERLSEAGSLGGYAQTKPPGTLLFYMSTERVVQALWPRSDASSRWSRLCTVAAWLWPFVSMLVLVPLYGVGERFFDGPTALLACGFYVLCPNVQLMTLHTDQVLFPLLATGLAFAAARALEGGTMVWGLGVGVLAYGCMFFSFPLGLAMPLGLGVEVVRTWGKAPSKNLGIRWGRTVGAMALGFFAMAVLLDCGVDYNFWVRWQTAMIHHRIWKRWDAHVCPTLWFGILNSLEFASWMGLPVAVAALSHGSRALKEAERHDRLRADVGLAGSLAAVYMACLLGGHVVRESGRLFLFLVPWFCLLAARAFVGNDGTSKKGWGGALALQGMTLLLTKKFQDFY